MKIFSLFLILLLLLSFSPKQTQTEALSCKYGGRGACIASCNVQNCATGYCGPKPDEICRCSRCNDGKPSYP